MNRRDYIQRPGYDGSNAAAFVAGLVSWLPGFHPDTPFAMYHDDDGLPVFVPWQADQLDAELDAAIRDLDVAGLDVYELALDTLHRKLTRGTV